MHKRPLLLLLMITFALLACRPDETPATPIVVVQTAVPPTPETVEVTRLVTETITETVTEVATVEVTPVPLGSDQRPVQLLFLPEADMLLLNERTAALADALSRATGQTVNVIIPDDAPTLIGLLCSAPADTVALLPPQLVALANGRCAAQPVIVALNAERLPYSLGMMVTGADSEVETIADAADLRWVLPSETQLATSLYFQAALADLRAEPESIVPVAGDNNALLALVEETADVATATFTPPLLPFGEAWQLEDVDPEPWRAASLFPARSPQGYIWVQGDPENGGYRPRDARAGIFDIADNVFQTTQIVQLSEPIPNESLVFGAAFPLALAQEIEMELLDLLNSSACQRSLCAPDWKAWQGAAPVTVAEFAPVQYIIEQLELEEEVLYALP